MRRFVEAIFLEVGRWHPLFRLPTVCFIAALWLPLAAVWLLGCIAAILISAVFTVPYLTLYMIVPESRHSILNRSNPVYVVCSYIFDQSDISRPYEMHTNRYGDKTKETIE